MQGGQGLLALMVIELHDVYPVLFLYLKDTCERNQPSVKAILDAVRTLAYFIQKDACPDS
jgi:hypothetical protein